MSDTADLANAELSSQSLPAHQTEPNPKKEFDSEHLISEDDNNNINSNKTAEDSHSSSSSRSHSVCVERVDDIEVPESEEGVNQNEEDSEKIENVTVDSSDTVDSTSFEDLKSQEISTTVEGTITSEDTDSKKVDHTEGDSKKNEATADLGTVDGRTYEDVVSNWETEASAKSDDIQLVEQEKSEASNVDAAASITCEDHLDLVVNAEQQLMTAPDNISQRSDSSHSIAVEKIEDDVIEEESMHDEPAADLIGAEVDATKDEARSSLSSTSHEIAVESLQEPDEIKSCPEEEVVVKNENVDLQMQPELCEEEAIVSDTVHTQHSMPPNPQTEEHDPKDNIDEQLNQTADQIVEEVEVKNENVDLQMQPELCEEEMIVSDTVHNQHSMPPNPQTEEHDHKDNFDEQLNQTADQIVEEVVVASLKAECESSPHDEPHSHKEFVEISSPSSFQPVEIVSKQDHVSNTPTPVSSESRNFQPVASPPFSERVIVDGQSPIRVPIHHLNVDHHKLFNGVDRSVTNRLSASKEEEVATPEVFKDVPIETGSISSISDANSDNGELEKRKKIEPTHAEGKSAAAKPKKVGGLRKLFSCITGKSAEDND